MDERSTRHSVLATARPDHDPHADVLDHRLKSRAATVSIVSNSVLIAFKLVVGFMSGSIAIVSEALHSGSDLIAAVIAFAAVRRAAQPPDARHQYGHEKVENVSGAIEALLIIGAAAVIIVEAVHKLIDGVTIDYVWLGVAVMGVSGAANLAVSQAVLYPVARRTHSAALEADAAHLLTDVYTSFGVAGGLVAVRLTGIESIDPIAAIAVATLIVRTGYRLVVGSTRVLLDETLDAEDLEAIRAVVNDHRGTMIAGYHKLRARQAGSRRHIDLHVTVDEALSVGEAHDVAEHIAADIRDRIPNSDVLVHIEPRSHERVDGS
ncbi:MAG TPA: cation diffusion facilitator family transporter [Thermoleophilia bacterium]|nr:cation diffusion facilitator family transporter [Thermoleophilia bacterium]